MAIGYSSQKMVRMRVSYPVLVGEMLALNSDQTVRPAHPGENVVGVAQTSGDAGTTIDVLLTDGNSPKRGTPVQAVPFYSDDEKGEVAHDLWRRALGEGAMRQMKDIVKQTVEQLASGRIELAEAAGILSRFGFTLPELSPGGMLSVDWVGFKPNKPEKIESARWLGDALMIQTTKKQMRLDRSLELLRQGGHDTPLRMLVSGRAGTILDEADAAFDAFEELVPNE